MKPAATRFHRTAAALCLCLAGLLGFPTAASAATVYGVDQNNNQLSDVFEALFPLAGTPAADYDNDGVTNSDENAAGTSPYDGAKKLDFSAVASGPATVSGSWSTVAGKLYQMQATSSLTGAWANEGAAVMGDGLPKTANCPANGSRMFLRVKVMDVDTDGDGATDWEELQTGTDPNVFDTDGDGRNDFDTVAGMIAGSSTVSVFAQHSLASESGPVAGSFLIVRRGGFRALTVPISFSGTATPGTDYAATATTFVNLPVGVNSAVVTVTPVVDSTPEDPETIILNLGSGANFTRGTAAATVTIASQGLVGQYFNTSNTTYTDPSNFDPAQLALTRRDGAIDFDWGSGTPSTLVTNDDSYSIRWTGYVVFPVTDSYTFHAYADRGVKVWINTEPVDVAVTTPKVNVWTTTNETTKYSSSASSRTAGQFYNVRIEYRDSATFANDASIRVLYSRAGNPGVEEVIPGSWYTSENTPPAAAGPVITSPLTTVAVTGAPFLYQITASNTPTAYNAEGLPGGLTINTTTGAISGSVAAAGVYFPIITATNATGADAKTLTIFTVGTGGSLTREFWTGLTGNGIQSVPLSTTPTTTSTVTNFAAPTNEADNFGDRLRGYLTAPISGNYTFFVSSDENTEFWLSANAEPARRLKRSWVVNGAGAIAPGTWNTQAGQTSIQVKLKAGDRHYVEAIRRETTGSDHLAVAWQKPGDSAPEVIPAYALSPWTTPTATTTTGTLYIATLTPQAGAVTTGSGTAVLRVNKEQTAADLTYTFTGLTGPVTQQHVHDQRNSPGPSKAIIFDLDMFPADSSGIYHWTFQPTGNHTVADQIAAITSGNAYLNLHTAAYPDGEIKGFFQTALGSQFFTPPAAPPAGWTSPAITDAEAVRFLEQATMGARRDLDGLSGVGGAFDTDSIEEVKRLGYAAWIDQQLAIPPVDPTSALIRNVPNPKPPDMLSETNLASYVTIKQLKYSSGPVGSYCYEYYNAYPNYGNNGSIEEIGSICYRGWWKSALTSQDQLRQRVAFALSQIMVASEQGALQENDRAVSAYYDTVLYHSLGNFRSLLEGVTRNVGMGKYLDMYRNAKPSGIKIPNENYAREIMQLFSIGLRRLHPDGTLVLDSQGAIVPTYTQDEIVGLAHVFTGWSHAEDNTNFNSGNRENYVLPMLPYDTQHANDEKLLLDATVLPATASGAAGATALELGQAHDLLYNHPNVGPFICRQLIQRMVTANPKPGYIYRVSRVFDDNGSGVRGDMKAVVKAILLDYEARALAPRSEPGYGHLREPVMQITALYRALRGYSRGTTYPAGMQYPTAFVAMTTPVDLSAALPVLPVGDPGAGKTNLDGIRLYTGVRILLTSQTAPAQNGLYVFNGDGQLLTRDPSADIPAELSSGRYVEVMFGTRAKKTYRTTTDPVTLGTDAITIVDNNGDNPAKRYWGLPDSYTAPFGQSPLGSPTVFNFYEPDYIYSGDTGAARLYGPEFQILSETTLVNFGNVIFDLLGQSTSATTYNGANGIGISTDIRLEFNARPTTWPALYPFPYTGDINDAKNNPEILIANDVAAIVERLNTLLLAGRMTTALRNSLTTYLTGLPMRTGTSNETADRQQRVRDGVYLITLSHEFAIQR